MKKDIEDLDFRGEEYVNEWTSWSPQDIRRKKGALEAARLMLNSALTAPVAGGVPSTEAHIVYGQEELETIARKMEEIAHQKEQWREPFLYEAVMVRDSDVFLFIGNTRCHETPLDAGCGLCGGETPMYKTKDEWWAPPEFMGMAYSPEAMEAMQQVLFEQVPEIVVKHADKIEARYKDKDK